MKKVRTRKNVNIEFSDMEKKEVETKREVINKSGLQFTHKYIYLTGLNKLYKQAKQFIDSE